MLLLTEKREHETARVKYYKKESNFVSNRNKHMISEEALDLLDKMLRYDKNDRIRPKDAMAHPYFDPVRDFLKEQ